MLRRNPLKQREKYNTNYILKHRHKRAHDKSQQLVNSRVSTSTKGRRECSITIITTFYFLPLKTQQKVKAVVQAAVIRECDLKFNLHRLH